MTRLLRLTSSPVQIQNILLQITSRAGHRQGSCHTGSWLSLTPSPPGCNTQIYGEAAPPEDLKPAAPLALPVPEAPQPPQLPDGKGCSHTLRAMRHGLCCMTSPEDATMLR